MLRPQSKRHGTMSLQEAKARAFRQLHSPGRPLILYNVWDPGSARAVEASGAKALATSSWSVADAHGYADREQLPRDLALANLARIAACADLPVSVDLEAGYGEAPDAVALTFTDTLETGAIGCNLEDSIPATGELRPVEAQVQRLVAARKAADRVGFNAFINARIDVFFREPVELHNREMAEKALVRAHAFADAGADGIFIPGVVDLDLISRLAKDAPLPLNIMVSEGSPDIGALARAGVARVSYGPGPYLRAMQALTTSARTALEAASPIATAA